MIGSYFLSSVRASHSKSLCIRRVSISSFIQIRVKMFKTRFGEEIAETRCCMVLIIITFIIPVNCHLDAGQTSYFSVERVGFSTIPTHPLDISFTGTMHYQICSRMNTAHNRRSFSDGSDGPLNLISRRKQIAKHGQT